MTHENKDILRDKAVKGVFWQLVTRSSSKIVTAVVSIALARILCPEDFGIVAMTSIFMAIIGLIADGGLGVSLVQKKEIDSLDTNTVFYSGLFLALILYIGLFFCAPLIARFYNTDKLIPVVRVIGLNLFFSSTNNVQSSLISRELAFKNLFYVSLVSSLVGGAVGIGMALSGKGYWSLIVMSITQTIANIITMNYLIHWRPKREFSFKRLKGLYSFGLNYMGANMIGTFFNELSGAMIGKHYQASDLAFYNRGGGLPSMANNAINGTISSVLFPTLSKFQNDPTQVKQSFRRSLRLSSFFVAPTMTMIAATAHNLVLILYSEKWISSVPFMQVIAFTTMFSIIGWANLQAINAVGRSDIPLKLEIFKKPIWLATILFTIRISPLALALGNALYTFYAVTVNIIPNKKLIGYSYREQISDIAPHILLALFCGGLAFSIKVFELNHYLEFILQVLVGGGSYLLLAKVFKFECFQYTCGIITEYWHKYQIKRSS